jgi:NTP pyrophosphatase (non-canonical NTP hydrolase)
MPNVFALATQSVSSAHGRASPAAQGRGLRGCRHYIQGVRTPKDEPDWIVFSGWQGGDDDHPLGQGIPAYRIVFKTLRAVIGEAEILWPNVRIRTGHGSVSRGGVNLPGALAARQAGRWVLPEYGRLVPDGDVFRYQQTGVENFVFAAWEDKVEDVFYVEFLLKTDSAEPSAQIVEGRDRLAELKTMFDIRFGPRILGVVLTEEAGEVFDDWHFNRRIGSDQIGHEFQLDVIGAEVDDLLQWQTTDMARYEARPVEEKRRLRLGSQWYWLAIHERDPVNQYLALWFVIEVLAMPDTNIRAVRELLATHVGGTEDEWREFVGRHLGRRSELVHGEAERAVAPEDLASLRQLVEVVLAIELSSLSDERASALRASAGVV